MCALSRLVEALELCQPLMSAIRAPLRVFPGGESTDTVLDGAAVARCNEVLAAIAVSRGLVIPEFVSIAPAHPSSLEVALSNLCEPEPGCWQAIAAAPPGADLLRAGGDREAVAPPVRRAIEAAGIPRFDSFSCGDPSDEAIVIIPPCGVPAALFRPWLTALSADRLVVTYENPYLFGDWESLPVPSGDLATEAAYVGAVLQAHGIARAHLIGICGGAPIAIAAAADLGDKVASLVVGHGDLNFGAAVPRTAFQKQFQGLLAEARTSLARARDVLELFLDPNILFGLPPRLAPFILYPYGDLALFHRYARINHGLMVYDASAAARRLDQRLLVLTSRTDRMTHPATSHRLHQTVRGSTLVERDTGTHHDILMPDDALFAAIRGFLDAPAEAGIHGGLA